MRPPHGGESNQLFASDFNPGAVELLQTLRLGMPDGYYRVLDAAQAALQLRLDSAAAAGEACRAERASASRLLRAGSSAALQAARSAKAVGSAGTSGTSEPAKFTLLLLLNEQTFVGKRGQQE